MMEASLSLLKRGRRGSWRQLRQQEAARRRRARKSHRRRRRLPEEQGSRRQREREHRPNQPRFPWAEAASRATCPAAGTGWATFLRVFLCVCAKRRRKRERKKLSFFGSDEVKEKKRWAAFFSFESLSFSLFLLPVSELMDALLLLLLLLRIGLCRDAREREKKRGVERLKRRERVAPSSQPSGRVEEKKTLSSYFYLPPMPLPAPMSKSIEEKASAFPALPLPVEMEAGGTRAGDSDEEVAIVIIAIDFAAAPMLPLVAAAASVAVPAAALLFIGAPAAPPRREDDEPPLGERDRPARPASGSPAGAIFSF